MNRADDRVTAWEWGMSCCCFLMGTTLRSVFISTITDNESWMIGIFGAVAYLPMAAIVLALLRKYPGMNLYQMADAALGKIGGRILGIMFLMFFVTLAALNLMDIGTFVTGYLIRKVPFFFVTAMTAAACAYVLRKGVNVLMRLIPVVLIAGCSLILLNALMSLERADFNNLLPIFMRTPAEYAHATVIALAIPFGESLTMIALVPLTLPGSNFRRPLTNAIIFTMIAMVVVHMRDIVALGSLLVHTSLPSFEVFRLVDSSSTFARTESFNAMMLTSLSFIKVTIVLFAVVQGVAHLTGLSSHKPVSILTCVFIAVYAASFHTTTFNNNEWFVYVAPIIWIVFEFALPSVMLCAGWLRARMLGRAAA